MKTFHISSYITGGHVFDKTMKCRVDIGRHYYQITDEKGLEYLLPIQFTYIIQIAV